MVGQEVKKKSATHIFPLKSRSQKGWLCWSVKQKEGAFPTTNSPCASGFLKAWIPHALPAKRAMVRQMYKTVVSFFPMTEKNEKRIVKGEPSTIHLSDEIIT